MQLSYNTVKAQEKDQYYELLMLLMDGEYEKCIKKGVKYNEDTDTRKDAMPYLYVSMANYEASQNPEVAVKFDNPLKEALKYAGKYYKKDKTQQYYAEHVDYFKKLRVAAKKEALELIEKEKDSKALYNYKQILNFDPSDYSCQYALALDDLEGGDTYGATEQFAAFKTLVAGVKDWQAEPADKKDLLEKVMIQHANFMVIKGRKDVATEVVEQLISYIGATEKIDRFRKNNGV